MNFKSTRLLSFLGLAVATSFTVSAAPVTFKVNMSVKAAEGLFDPAADTVDVRGSFNGWSHVSDLTDEDGDKVYEGTFEVGDELVGASVEYKYVFVKDGTDNWESIDNRRFTLEAGGQALPVLFYNNDEVVSLNIKAEINFQLDMNVQIASGNFNKETDEVYVRGNKMGWGTPPQGLKLEEDPARPGVYIGTYPMDSLLTGDLIEYKYTIWKPDTSFTGWEDGANKTLTFSGSEPDADTDTYLEQSLPKVFFNGLSFNDVLREDTVVTFRVDMSSATRQDGTPFDPENEGVWVNGNFASWYSWGSQPDEYKMFDDGTNGDAVAGDHIYTAQRTIPRGTGRMLDYKYGIESQDNEAGFANNHVRYINADGTYTLPLDTFGNMIRETAGGLGSISIARNAGGTITLSWNGGAGVLLQKATTLTNPTWETVAGTDGASTAQISADGSSGFYRLTGP